jgi:hypothetical protein
VKNNKNKSIPKLCQENWLDLTTNEQGKFCMLCNKNVFLDFKNDKDILEALEKNPYLCDENAKKEFDNFINKKSSN